MTPIQATQIELLVRQNQNGQDISKALGLSASTIYDYIRKHKLLLTKPKTAWNKGVRDSAAQDRHLMYRQEGAEKAKNHEPLHVMGCMLYWGEGTKAGPTVEFTNCDVVMLRLFVKFMRTYFPSAVSRVSVSYYATMGKTYEAIQSYWCQELGLTESDFTQARPREKYYKAPLKSKYPNGILRIRYHSSRILDHISGAIQEYSSI